MAASPNPARPRFDVSHPRAYIDGNGAAQTRWTSIGTAFLGDAGISLILQYIPTAIEEGQTRCTLFPAKGDGESTPMPEGLPERFDVCHYRRFQVNREERTTRSRVGVAFTKRDCISVLLDSIPAARTEGAVRLFLRDASEQADAHDELQDDGVTDAAA